ncbi:MAG: hypothetical protein HS115_02170 [Spirochaetales bacterium]|nr:hypothetical protein [Spirochaetales bacterium]
MNDQDKWIKHALGLRTLSARERKKWQLRSQASLDFADLGHIQTAAPSFADRRAARRALKRFEQSVQGNKAPKRATAYLIPAAGFCAVVISLSIFWHLRSPVLPDFPDHLVGALAHSNLNALQGGGLSTGSFLRLGYHLYHLERQDKPVSAEERYRLLGELEKSGIAAAEAARLNESWGGALTGPFSFSRESTRTIFHLLPRGGRNRFALGYRLGYLRYELESGSPPPVAIARAGIAGQSDPYLGLTFSENAMFLEGQPVSPAEFLRTLDALLHVSPR